MRSVAKLAPARECFQQDNRNNVRAAFHFDLHDLPDEVESLRLEVRECLRNTLGPTGGSERSRSAMVTGFDRTFARMVGERGWVGMTWPKRYGGQERSALERYVVIEEMLAAGAPVAAHLVADRQSGPLLIRYGTEEQRQGFLPRIARGELAFAIGMSEPDSGRTLRRFARGRCASTAATA